MIFFHLVIYGSGIWAGLSWVAHVASAGAAEMRLKDLPPRWRIHMTSRWFLAASWELSQTSVSLHVSLSMGLFGFPTARQLGSKNKVSKGLRWWLQSFF